MLKQFNVLMLKLFTVKILKCFNVKMKIKKMQLNVIVCNINIMI